MTLLSHRRRSELRRFILKLIGISVLLVGLAGSVVASLPHPSPQRVLLTAAPRELTPPEPTSTTSVPKPPPPIRSRPPVVARGSAPAGGHRGCGRSLDQIGQDESRGDYSAQNSSSTASGKYQVLDSTWAGYGGYARAKDAPPAVQEQQAQQMYAQYGTTPWRASGC